MWPVVAMPHSNKLHQSRCPSTVLYALFLWASSSLSYRRHTASMLQWNTLRQCTFVIQSPGHQVGSVLTMGARTMIFFKLKWFQLLINVPLSWFQKVFKNLCTSALFSTGALSVTDLINKTSTCNIYIFMQSWIWLSVQRQTKKVMV